MLSKKVKVSTVVLTLSLLLAGCSSTAISGSENSAPESTISESKYAEGYEDNSEADPAIISDFGGIGPYCRRAAELHTNFKVIEANQYVEGCLDILKEKGLDSASESEGQSSDSSQLEPAMTLSQENAVATAQDYLDYGAFSRKGLIEQLEFEKFSNADSTFAVDYLNPDWNEQAAKAAQEYLDYSSFSRQGLIDQLIFEGYTQQQAEYGVNQTGL